MANKKLATTITIGGTVTAGLRSAVGSTQSMLRGVGKELDGLRRRQKLLSEGIDVFGRMGKNVDGLRAKYAATVTEVDRLRAAQKRLADAQVRADRINARAATVTKAGATATVAGGALLASTVPGVKEAKHYQAEQAKISAMGFSKADQAEAFEAADHAKQFGVSRVEKVTLMRDALGAFGDVHHAKDALPFLAKMKFANEAVFGGAAAEKTEASFRDLLKTAEMLNAASPERFAKLGNIIQQVVSGSGGAVDPTQWRQFVARGGVSVARMNPEAMYRMSHMVAEMGGDTAGQSAMSAYQNVAVGKTTKQAMLAMDKYGLIADKSKVTPDKAGQLAHIGPGALKGYDLFVEDQLKWNKEVLVPTLRAKKLSDKQIEQVISQIFSNRNAAALHIRAFQQSEVLDKTEAVNRRADNVDKLEEVGRESTRGKEIEAEKKLADLKLKMGQEVMPMYIKALEMGTDALKAFNDMAEKNPGITKAILVGLTGVGVGLTVLGPLLTAAGGFMTVYAAIQLRTAANATAAAAAIRAETGAIVAQGNAATVAGGKLAAFAKRLAVGLALANIGDAVAGKFGVGKDKADQDKDDANWNRASTWEKVQSAIPRAIESTGRFIGMTNIADEAQAGRVKSETEYLDKKYGQLPQLRGGDKPADVTTTNNNTFNITQQQGQDANALADQIMKRIERQSAVNARSSMTDQ